MGMFSTVVVDGQEIQFKTGGDDCDTYRVGDVVAWWVDKDIAHRGGLLDGVYEGYYRRNLWWVGIKDHRLIFAVPTTPDDKHRHYQELLAKYQIPEEPPRELWTEAAWEQDKESRELFLESARRAEAAGIDPISYFTRQKMREPSFIRQILPGYEEPKELQAGDRLLKVGETYQHFGRSVVLRRIYERDLVGILYPKGTIRCVPVDELTDQN